MYKVFDFLLCLQSFIVLQSNHLNIACLLKNSVSIYFHRYNSLKYFWSVPFCFGKFSHCVLSKWRSDVLFKASKIPCVYSHLFFGTFDLELLFSNLWKMLAKRSWLYGWSEASLIKYFWNKYQLVQYLLTTDSKKILKMF